MEHHDGTPPPRRDQGRWLALALVLNAVIVGVQVVGGLLSGSLGLLADAAHNLTDVAALGVALYAARLVRRPATSARSFGWHRSTVLAAQANAAALLAVTALVGYEAIRRLAAPPSVDGAPVAVVAGIAVLVNSFGAAALRDHGGDLNGRAAMLHLLSDAAASTGVLVAGVVIAVTGRFDRLDPIVSLVIGAMIAVQAFRLVRDANEVLLESTPRGLDLSALTTVMGDVPGVEEVHDVHAWSLSTDVRALSAHLVMAGHPSLEEAQAVAGAVKQAIAEPFGITHATFELECETCVDPDVDPCDLR